jgi:hypothetical protein
MLWKIYDSKPNNWTFDFIYISTQILNKISKVQQNEKEFNLCRNGKNTMLLSIKFRSYIMFIRIPSLSSVPNMTNSFVNQGSFYCKLHNHSQTTIICNF